MRRVVLFYSVSVLSMIFGVLINGVIHIVPLQLLFYLLGSGFMILGMSFHVSRMKINSWVVLSLAVLGSVVGSLIYLFFCAWFVF